MHSPILKEAVERGFIHQMTHPDALDEKLSQEKITLYIGFDPTGHSLHVGHMVSLMLLRLFQRHGHRPILLMGGATAGIGDPTFKDTLRPRLDQETIQTYQKTIKECFTSYVHFDAMPSQSPALMLNNHDWLSKIQYLDFLQQYASHFTINRMLTFDSVQLRLSREQPLTLLEFNYMVLQAIDFVHLAKTHACVLQCGGSDQWGNIVNGVELGRRLLQKNLFGLTTPLITTSSGAKMGKTEKGAVWLHKDYLSA